MEVLATEQQVLSPDPRIAVRKETETTFLLTLRDITALDKGEYVCQVHHFFSHVKNVFYASFLKARCQNNYLNLKMRKPLKILRCYATYVLGPIHQN
jgi:hypothetical protein